MAGGPSVFSVLAFQQFSILAISRAVCQRGGVPRNTPGAIQRGEAAPYGNQALLRDECPRRLMGHPFSRPGSEANVSSNSALAKVTTS